MTYHSSDPYTLIDGRLIDHGIGHESNDDRGRGG